MSVSKHVIEHLGRYSVGEKLRSLRLRRKLSLAELGKHSGFSSALLSKIECGKIIPTVPTLMQIALVFGVGLDYFFADDSKKRTVVAARRTDRILLHDAQPSGAGYEFECLNFDAFDRKMDGYIAHFKAGDAQHCKMHLHLGVELIYVLSGTLGIRIGVEEYTLQAGDALYFDSNVRHGYWQVGDEQCTALVVTHNPNREWSERRLSEIKERPGASGGASGLNAARAA